MAAVWTSPPQGEGIVNACALEEGEVPFGLDLLSDVEVMPAELPSAELPVPRCSRTAWSRTEWILV